jgi:hypothetical protein
VVGKHAAFFFPSPLRPLSPHPQAARAPRTPAQTGHPPVHRPSSGGQCRWRAKMEGRGETKSECRRRRGSGARARAPCVAFRGGTGGLAMTSHTWCRLCQLKLTIMRDGGECAGLLGGRARARPSPLSPQCRRHRHRSHCHPAGGSGRGCLSARVEAGAQDQQLRRWLLVVVAVPGGEGGSGKRARSAAPRQRVGPGGRPAGRVA